MTEGKPSIKEVIEAIRGSSSIEQAALKLGISKERVKLYTYALAAHGKIRPYKLDHENRVCDCSSCIFRKICGK